MNIFDYEYLTKVFYSAEKVSFISADYLLMHSNKMKVQIIDTPPDIADEANNDIK
jgi:hypothetical protein